MTPPPGARRTLIGCALVTSLVVVLALSDNSTTAVATSRYPTWEEVVAARDSVEDADALLRRLTAERTELGAAAEQAADDAAARGLEFESAELAAQEAIQRTTTLQGQRDDAAAKADSSRATAARLFTQMARAGGGDLTSRLLTGGGEPTDLLRRLGLADKVGERLDTATQVALRDARALAALTDQASAAAAERDRLRQQAEDVSVAAQAASAAADELVRQNQESGARMQAQMTVLRERRAVTEADFAAGERVRAEAAAAAAASAGGTVGPNGWAKPTTGAITSPFGYRIHPVYGTRRLHTGLDVAGGCGTPIYASAGGTVTYSGWYGTYGNWITIDHGDGIVTGYAHIADGGRVVSAGQRVQPGQLIARQGTTGASTGCHLHVEVRSGGTARDPLPFFREREVAF